MNNNDFMNLLTVVHKNDNKNKQLIVIGALAGLALVGCYLLYLKDKETTKRYNTLKSEYYNDKAQIVINNAQIIRLNNTIKQLKAEKEVKPDNPGNNNTSSSQGDSNS